MKENTFEVGKKYWYKFIGDSDLRVEITIVERTEKTIVIKDDFESKNKRLKIQSDGNSEYILPLGKFSFAPKCMATHKKF